MRELKFRAWSLERKCYVDIWEITFDDEGLPGVLSFEYGGLLYKEPVHNFIIEQYTGLKDKNGKEIYDGDIIVDFDEFISVVDGNCAVISEKTCREKYFDEDDCSLERRTRPLIFVVNDYGYYPEKKETQVEVIGNIHENPELLEGKK